VLFFGTNSHGNVDLVTKRGGLQGMNAGRGARGGARGGGKHLIYCKVSTRYPSSAVF
jgi:hypothetical protein